MNWFALDQHLHEVSEQLANFKARQAEALVRTKRTADGRTDGDLKRAHMLIDQAEEMLEKLIGLGIPLNSGRLSTETSERYALKGSITKRRAMIAALEKNDDDALSRLEKMRDAYEKAEELGQHAEKDPDPYPIVQQILAATLQGKAKLSKEQQTALQQKLQPVLDNAQTNKADQRDFWSRAALADYLLVDALIEGNLPDRVEEIVERSRDAQTRGASLREWRSVLENLDFVRILVDLLWPAQKKTEVLRAVTSIYQGLEWFVATDDGMGGRRSVRQPPK